jgi:hypothetical protein
MKASKLHRDNIKEQQLQQLASDTFHSNTSNLKNNFEKDKTCLYPYADDAIFRKLMKNPICLEKQIQNVQHDVVKENNSIIDKTSNRNLFLLQILFTTLKNVILLLLLLFLIWPATILVKVFWIISKYLSPFFPNLEDICELFDNFYVKLLYYEDMLMDKISSIKY